MVRGGLKEDPPVTSGAPRWEMGSRKSLVRGEVQVLLSHFRG